MFRIVFNLFNLKFITKATTINFITTEIEDVVELLLLLL